MMCYKHKERTGLLLKITLVYSSMAADNKRKK